MMVKSSPPLVQPEVDDRLACRGLDGAMETESSSIEEEWWIGVMDTASSTAVTNHILIIFVEGSPFEITFCHIRSVLHAERQGGMHKRFRVNPNREDYPNR